MNKFFFICCLLTLQTTWALGQAMGNVGYQNNKSTPRPNTKTVITLGDTAVMLTARVLLNAIADQYVMTIATAQEGATLKDANNKLQQKLDGFTKALQNLKVAPQDYYIDFIAQHKIYEYEVLNNTLLQEKLKGFEVKKNITIRFTDKKLIETLQLAAAEYQLYDIVKVEYLSNHNEQVRQQLWEEATKIIEQKRKNYVNYTQNTLKQNFIISEDFAINTPTDMYESYKAYEAGSTNEYEYDDYRNRLKKVNLRKITTFYLNPLQANGFDKVINPIVIEPVLQYVYQLEVKCLISK